MLDYLVPAFQFKLVMMELNKFPSGTKLSNDAATRFIPAAVDCFLGPPEPKSGSKLPRVYLGKDSFALANFVWLMYLPGFVTYAPLDGMPILTGRMSGCWLSVFKMNGRKYLAHIGTANEDPNATNMAKACWGQLPASKGVEPFQSVRPDLQIKQPSNSDRHLIAGLSTKAIFSAISCSIPWAGDYKVEQVAEVDVSSAAPIFT